MSAETVTLPAQLALDGSAHDVCRACGLPYAPRYDAPDRCPACRLAAGEDTYACSGCSPCSCDSPYTAAARDDPSEHEEDCEYRASPEHGHWREALYADYLASDPECDETPTGFWYCETCRDNGSGDDETFWCDGCGKRLPDEYLTMPPGIDGDYQCARCVELALVEDGYTSEGITAFARGERIPYGRYSDPGAHGWRLALEDVTHAQIIEGIELAESRGGDVLIFDAHASEYDLYVRHDSGDAFDPAIGLPDASGELFYGFRKYRIDGDGCLEGQYNGQWTGPAFVARCNGSTSRAARHLADGQCSCGVYSVKDRRNLRRSYGIGGGDVLALCISWGVVAERELGYVATDCRIERLWIANTVPDDPNLERLRKRYGVPVERLELIATHDRGYIFADEAREEQAQCS